MVVVEEGLPLDQSQLCWLVLVMELKAVSDFWVVVVPQRKTSSSGCRRMGW